MKTNCKRLIAVAITICGVFIADSMGQQSPTTRPQPPRVIHYNGDMSNLLAHLPGIYDATIGLEVDPQQSRSVASIELVDAQLTDVLNAIVRSVPRYQWRESGEFIELLPVGGGSPLLDTLIMKFQVKDVGTKEAINQLLLLPEVQAFMRSMSLAGKEVTEPGAKKFSLSLENVTMREALHRIAKESGTKFWIFRWDTGRFFSIHNSPR